MPQLIKYLDKIAREKERAVLAIFFQTDDYESSDIRKNIIDFLNKNNIGFEECGDVASEYFMTSYAGQLYIDIPFDEGSLDYQKVQAYLEHPDGSMRHPDATFVYLPLENAMKNAHHDAPGFWDNWAEHF